MRSKVLEKAYAVGLRKKGFSYNEILRKVPAAKSTLSLWLRETPLSDDEKRLLKTRKSSNTSLGRLKAAAALRAKREERDGQSLEEMRAFYKAHRDDPFFTAGLALYWAEGAKRSGGAFLFTNSDPDMHKVMLGWLETYFPSSRERVAVRLYSHKPFAHEDWEGYWVAELGIPRSVFKKTVYKPAGKLVKKRPNYRGCLRIEITRGLLARKIGFLTDSFLEDYGKGSRVNRRP